jgi:hypothetical protein
VNAIALVQRIHTANTFQQEGNSVVLSRALYLASPGLNAFI